MTMTRHWKMPDFSKKNVNTCLEYEDAWIFRNSNKKPGAYNPCEPRDGSSFHHEYPQASSYVEDCMRVSFL